MTGGGGENEREGGPGDGEGQRGEAGSEPGEWAVDPQECLRAGLRCVVSREWPAGRSAQPRAASQCAGVWEQVWNRWVVGLNLGCGFAGWR